MQMTFLHQQQKTWQIQRMTKKRRQSTKFGCETHTLQICAGGRLRRPRLTLRKILIVPSVLARPSAEPCILCCPIAHLSHARTYGNIQDPLEEEIYRNEWFSHHISGPPLWVPGRVSCNTRELGTQNVLTCSRGCHEKLGTFFFSNASHTTLHTCFVVTALLVDVRWRVCIVAFIVAFVSLSLGRRSKPTWSQIIGRTEGGSVLLRSSLTPAVEVRPLCVYVHSQPNIHHGTK